MAKDTYLIEMYNKLKGTTKANFNNHITESQNVCSVFESSLKNVKERVTKAEWDDDIETLVELNLEEVTKFKNYCNDYMENVITPLAEKTELLENLLKTYVEGSEKLEKNNNLVEVKDKYFEDAFHANKIDDWIAEPYKFRRLLDEYYKPTDTLVDEGSASIDLLVDEFLAEASTLRKEDVSTDEILTVLKDKVENNLVRTKVVNLEDQFVDKIDAVALDGEQLRKECYEAIKDIATLLDDDDMILTATKGINEASSNITTFTVKAKAVSGGASDGSGDVYDSIDKVGYMEVPTGK